MTRIHAVVVDYPNGTQVPVTVSRHFHVITAMLNTVRLVNGCPGNFGHDFYLTREGHGAGFWDRGLGDLGRYLTDIAKWAGAASELWDKGNGELSA